MVKVSVIIPVYNAAAHLAEALESVRAQTFRDWKCICVDDGSTDSSPEILRRIAAEDSRFRVVRQKNSGPGAARNNGMDYVDSPWFFFMDSDDILHLSALERLVEAGEDSRADVVGMAFVNSKEELSEMGAVTAIGDPVAQMCTDRSWRGMVWGRLYRTAVCGGIKFPKWNNHEDVVWSTEVYACISYAVELSAPLYFYRPSPNGLSRSLNADLTLPKLWRRQVFLCPCLRHRLGEVAYNYWKSNPKEVSVELLMRLRREKVLSFKRLSFSKCVRLLVSYVLRRIGFENPKGRRDAKG